MEWCEEHLPNNYKEHGIFEILDSINDFYGFLSFNSRSYLTEGLPGIFPNIDSYVFSSIKGILDSISLLLKNARINDAFAIARKYFDEIVLNVYMTIYRKEQIIKNQTVLLFTVERVRKWMDDYYKMPTYSNILKYFYRSESYNSLFTFFDFENRYRIIRDLLDDNMHMNSFQLMVNNDNEIYNQSRVKYLNTLKICICDLFRYHFASCLYLNPHYFMATDYMDHLDLGMTPPEGSENWIAPIAQDMFNKAIKPYKELAMFIKDNICLEIE